MKKTLSLILALILCLSLCACAGSESTLSEAEEALVGEWEASGNKAGFILLSSGNAIVNRDSLDFCADQLSSAYSGSWEVEGNFLIIHFEEIAAGASLNSARVYRIVSNIQVTAGDTTYTKK